MTRRRPQLREKLECPSCGSLLSRVVNHRRWLLDADDAGAVVRWRQCLACLKRFETHERVIRLIHNI